MREIKFRVWDTVKRKMSAPFDILEVTVMGWEEYEGDIRLQNCDSPYEYFPIMQFTGLRDKNGKEIYEGDIVRYFEDWGMEIKTEVKFNHGYYSPFVHVEEGHGDSLEDYEPGYYEVIGNVHENPELLEGKP